MVRVLLLVYLNDGQRWFFPYRSDSGCSEGNERQELGGGGAHCGVEGNALYSIRLMPANQNPDLNIPALRKQRGTDTAHSS